jgi:hypothetical protein
VSRSYEFRKIYVDVVTPSKTVYVLYLTWVKLAGVWVGRSGVERYDADGTRVLRHGSNCPARLDDSATAGDTCTRVEFEGGFAEFDLQATLGRWAPADPGNARGLHWAVINARTRARVVWSEAGNTREERGEGYADWVEIERPTRLLHLDSLRWCRVHLPDETIVLEHLETEDGRRWDTGIRWTLGASRPTAITPRTSSERDGVWHSQLDDVAVLAIEAERVLHAGDAFDDDRLPRAVDRAVCKVLGGQTWERRWIGRATLGEREGVALFEQVWFGRN